MFKFGIEWKDEPDVEMTGLKSKFQREGAQAGQFDDVASVAKIAPPQPSRDTTDVEDLDPPDQVKRKLPGLIDAGEVGLTLNFDPADEGHTALEADFYAGTVKAYRILLPNGYAWTCKGFVSGWAPSELDAGSVLQSEVKITLTEKPTMGPVGGA